MLHINLFQIWRLDLLFCQFPTHLFFQFFTVAVLFMTLAPNLMRSFWTLPRQLQQK